MSRWVLTVSSVGCFLCAFAQRILWLKKLRQQATPANTVVKILFRFIEMCEELLYIPQRAARMRLPLEDL
jgi:hypothetical protein